MFNIYYTNSTKPKFFTCKFCNEVFVTKINFKSHVYKKHLEELCLISFRDDKKNLVIN